MCVYNLSELSCAFRYEGIEDTEVKLIHFTEDPFEDVSTPKYK